MSAFDKAFDELIGLEGNYSDDENDPGNWTGGAVNKGVLKGTHWGVSAKAYPGLDIINLTRDDAKGIYRTDYWQALKCDAFVPEVASALFKQGVNQGVGSAARELQEALGVTVDGAIGAKTIGTATAMPADDVLVNFMTVAILRYTSEPNHERYGKGWVRRAVRTALQAKVS